MLIVAVFEAISIYMESLYADDLDAFSCLEA